MMPSTSYYAFIVLALLCASEEVSTATPSVDLLKIFPWYHTTSMISQELHQIAAESPFINLEKEKIKGTDYSVDIVTVRQGNPKYRFFMLAGEHARELISPESALHFVKALSGQVEDVKPMVENVLKQTEFRIVVNGNPLSRTKVEEGDFCLRVTSRHDKLTKKKFGVFLCFVGNWGDHWEKESVSGHDTNPGDYPFSEPEAQIFKKAVETFDPHTFLSVHSGTLGMYMPFAYSGKPPTRNKKNMIHVLRHVDSVYCKCPFGPAGAEVGYRSYGTCLDYVYEKLKVPFSYAFEIYTNKERQAVLHTVWDQALKKNHVESLHSLRSPFDSDFLETKIKKYKNMRAAETVLASDMDCFRQFNPNSQEEYEATLNNWSKAYLTLAEEAVTKLK